MFPSVSVTNIPDGNACFPSVDVITFIYKHIRLNVIISDPEVSVDLHTIVQTGDKLVLFLTEHFPVVDLAYFI